LHRISSLFFSAYGKAATIANAASGFKKTGIWPVKADIFEDFLFAPLEITKKPIQNRHEDQHFNPRPCKDVPYSSSALSEADKSDKQVHNAQTRR
jgi:hypothetical protein